MSVLHPILATKKAVFFDLDGTLVDSAQDIHASLNHSMHAHGLVSVTLEQVRSWVGRGAKVLVAEALKYHYHHPSNPQLHFQPPTQKTTHIHIQSADFANEQVFLNTTVAILLKTFLAHYQSHVCLHSSVYTGVLPLLHTLKTQHKMICCITNKPEQPARTLLTELALFDYFDAIIGGDSLPQKKPHPLPLTHMLTTLKLTATNAIMVGDSKFDVQAAQAADMQSIAVTYGYNHGEDIAKSHPSLIIDSFTELVTFK